MVQSGDPGYDALVELWESNARSKHVEKSGVVYMALNREDGVAFYEVVKRAEKSSGGVAMKGKYGVYPPDMVSDFEGASG